MPRFSSSPLRMEVGLWGQQSILIHISSPRVIVQKKQGNMACREHNRLSVDGQGPCPAVSAFNVHTESSEFVRGKRSCSALGTTVGDSPQAITMMPIGHFYRFPFFPEMVLGF